VNHQEAQQCLRQALLQVVPDADLEHLAADEPLRDALELDSLDFLSFVEHLSAATHLRIDEGDYRKLTTYQSCVLFLDSAVATAG